MEFIVRMQAESEIRMAKFDKRLEATRKVVEVGMKLLVKIDKKHLELAKQISALTEAQRKTDRKFDRLRIVGETRSQRPRAKELKGSLSPTH